MNKMLSIITNFGCHFECPECIVKNSGIDVPQTTIGGLAQLDSAFRNNLCKVVSISGGGDPLFNYGDNFNWYRALFKWARSYKKIRFSLNVPSKGKWIPKLNKACRTGIPHTESQ